MVTVNHDESAEVVDRVRAWPSENHVNLVKQVLDPLLAEPLGVWTATAGPSAEAIRRIFESDMPAPDDEMVRQWIDEHRMAKYG